jgi:hypothetical protein
MDQPIVGSRYSCCSTGLLSEIGRHVPNRRSKISVKAYSIRARRNNTIVVSGEFQLFAKEKLPQNHKQQLSVIIIPNLGDAA